MLVAFLFFQSCASEGEIEVLPVTPDPVIEVTYEIKAKGKLDGELTYNTRFGKTFEVISGSWIKTIKVSADHHLQFTASGFLTAGIMEATVVARHKNSGEIIFSQTDSKSALNSDGTQFDFVFETENLR